MKILKTMLIATGYVALFILIIISGTRKVNAAEATPMVTDLKENTIINKIFAKGNVEVFITQGEQQSIKVYDNYYGKNALTQVENDGTLRISSYGDKKLSIWVTLKDLKSITAYDHALVYSLNKFNSLELNITLGNDAVANLNVDTYQLTTNLSNSSKLILKGSSEIQNVSAFDDANVDVSKFTASSENVKLKDHSSITLGNQQSFKAVAAKCENPKCTNNFDLVIL